MFRQSTRRPACAYGKPRGYPGDFNAIEIIYPNQPAGDDLRDIFARTAFGASSLRFKYEPLRANLFAITSQT